MTQNAMVGSLPFPNTKPDQNDKAKNERGQCTWIRPREEVAAQVETNQEEGQSECQEATSDQIKVAELLPDGQMI